MPAAADPAACVRAALQCTEKEARGAASACIMICDVTRPVPNGLVLRPLIERLWAAGVPADAVTVLVATGLHRPNDGAELAAVVGDPWVAEHAVIANHFARDDEAHVTLGTTSQGVPVRLDRRVVNADVRIAVGLVEPHFMAGWSGGRKLVLPGCAHADTITAFHSTRMLEHPKAAACSLGGNPLHEAQGEALRMIGRTLAVSMVINDQRELAFAHFGGAEESLAAAVAFADPYVRVGVPADFPRGPFHGRRVSAGLDVVPGRQGRLRRGVHSPARRRSLSCLQLWRGFRFPGVQGVPGAPVPRGKGSLPRGEPTQVTGVH